MIWLTGFLSLAVGIIIGAALFKIFKSDSSKIKLLEEQLDALIIEHEGYKSNVHSHFNTTAQLVHELSDSYRNVYRHLANGAEDLCPEYISNQLSLAAQDQDKLTQSGNHSNNESSKEGFSPPRDYASKSSPDQKGNLAEDFGLDKLAEEESQTPPTL